MVAIYWLIQSIVESSLISDLLVNPASFASLNQNMEGTTTSLSYSINLSPLTHLGGLALTILGASVTIGFLHFVDGRKDENVIASTFAGFTQGRIWAFLLNWLIQHIFISLWSLLFVIPGLIKSYSYAMSFYILDDLKRQGRELSATEAITKSRQLMDGHKWELFVLDLSFLGWGLLACLTLGIGFLWLIPYIETTRAEFYRSLVAQNPGVLAE